MGSADQLVYLVNFRSGDRDRVEVEEVGASDIFGRNISINHSANVRAFEEMWVTSILSRQTERPTLAMGSFGRANFISPGGRVFRVPLENYDYRTGDTMPPGYFQAMLHTENVLGQIGSAETLGKWRIELHAQHVNAAPPGLDPFDAAKLVGGDALLAPIALHQLEKEPSQPDGEKEKDKSKCQPDKTLDVWVFKA